MTDRFHATEAAVEFAGTADDPLRWYVLRTAPQKELRVNDALAEKGIVSYVPLATRWHRPAPTRKVPNPAREVRSLPLFRGYVFVAFMNRPRFREVLSVEGVHDFVRIEGAPVSVHDGSVDRLARQEADGEFDQTRLTRQAWKEGQQVKITHGPFTGHVGGILKVDGDKLQIHLSGKHIRGDFTLDNDHVVPIAA